MSATKKLPKSVTINCMFEKTAALLTKVTELYRILVTPAQGFKEITTLKLCQFYLDTEYLHQFLQLYHQILPCFLNNPSIGKCVLISQCQWPAITSKDRKN